MKWLLIACGLLLLLLINSAATLRLHESGGGNGRRAHGQRTAAQRAGQAPAAAIKYERSGGGGGGDSLAQDDNERLAAATLAVDALQCPVGCVCQYARFLDLPISRWINYMQMRRPASSPSQSASGAAGDNDDSADDTAEVPIMRGRRRGSGGHQHKNNHHARPMIKRAAAHNSNYYSDNNNNNNYRQHKNNNANYANEVTYEASAELPEDNNEDADDEDEDVARAQAEGESGEDEQEWGDADAQSSRNALIKQATCILQEETNVAALVESLPHDLQALILLYTGIGRNKTVNVSDLKPLNQLGTLEIRGPEDRTMSLVFDEPLAFLLHANFESITLLRGDTFNRPRNAKHPSDSFDYKPKGEFSAPVAAAADELLTTRKLDFKGLETAPEILPYDVYLQRMKEARMPAFYGWERLQVLRIHSCQLSELYWEMFDGLRALQHLSLERNGIGALPPFALYGAPHIKTLSLAHNQLRDLHYRALAGLLELRWLDLSDNRLGRLSEKSFPPFPRLQRVDFSRNPIRHIYPASFWVMNATRELHFESRAIALELWNDAPFASLRRLRELVVGNVSIASLEQNVFRGLESLQTLRLKGAVRSIEFDAFAGLTALHELDLDDCGIRRLSMDAFMGCKQLTIVRLARNNLTHIPPGLFDDQPRLAEVYLQGNQLRTLPGGFFVSSPQLRLARLADNPWQCTCDMQSWRPRVTNQQRATSAATERCITDFRTGVQLSCRQIDEFQFDRRLAPRCDNFNGRSVFYVLRKQLQCGPGRLVHRVTKAPPLSGTELRAEQKLRRNMAQRNTLQYALHAERRKAAAAAATAAAAAAQQTPVGAADTDISNDI